jgi:hypothetical protein
MFETNSLATRAVPGIGTEWPMTAPHAIARTPSPVTDTVIDRADADVRMRLAVSGWRIVWRLQPDGRTVVEVCDETWELTGLIAGTRLPILSADAGWRGVTRRGGGGRRCWALAIGHAPAGVGRPAITFTRGQPGSRRARRMTVRPDTMGGLWVAAVLGRYTTVRCQLTTPVPARLISAPCACLLASVTAWPARW